VTRLDRDFVVGQDGGVDSLHEGQKIWVEQPDGSQRKAIFVGEAAQSWFGGSPGAYVAYPDTRSGEEVAMMRIVPRDDSE
jgi:hypothetical protein